jgi:hypothetical protein
MTMINRIAWHPKLTVWITITLLAAGSIMFMTTPAARAHTICKTDIFGNKYDCRRHRHYRKVRRRKENKNARVYGYTRRKKLRCLGRVRAVGSQWIGADGAKTSAIKAWREIVRFDSGEKFSDWTNAKDVVQGCSQSSIGEVIGKVFYRCEVSATPCKMQLTRDGR